ncbi:hemolysin activation/secretion protein [Metapseudomonas resinovorans]|uniref:hypothetical protein n=1 Tax=Metapseudomonas resinovorans TaxID=53412 RepID=UPI003D20DD0F
MRPLKLDVVVISLFMVGAHGLASADVSPGDRDLIRDRQERLLQEQQKRLEELQQLPGKAVEAAPPAPVEEGRCFEIRRIDLKKACSIACPMVGGSSVTATAINPWSKIDK